MSKPTTNHVTDLILSKVGAIAEQAWVNWPSMYNSGTVESNDQVLVRLVPLLMANIVATVLIGTKVL